MLQYILKRLALMVPTLLGVLLLTFVVIQFVPGGRWSSTWPRPRPVRVLGPRAVVWATEAPRAWTPNALNKSKHSIGFDKPAHERFWQMLTQFARFDLGRSFYQNRDVADLIWEKLPVSMSLGLWTFFISYLVAVPLGVAKAVRAGSRFEFVDLGAHFGGLCDSGFRAGRGLAGGALAGSCNGFRCAA